MYALTDKYFINISTKKRKKKRSERGTKKEKKETVQATAKLRRL